MKCSSAEVAPEERDGEPRTMFFVNIARDLISTTFDINVSSCFSPDDLSSGSLPLVNISVSVSLSAAAMTMYLKKMSRGEAVEGE